MNHGSIARGNIQQFIQVLLTSFQLVCGLCVLFLHGRSSEPNAMFWSGQSRVPYFPTTDFWCVFGSNM